MTELTISNSSNWPERSVAHLLISQMIRNEYQLKITSLDKTALIAFSKGVFFVCVDEILEISDSPQVLKPSLNILDGAFIQAKIDYYLKKLASSNKQESFFRNTPAKAITDYLDLKLKISTAPEVKVEILQPGRNGYINESHVIELSRKDW